MCDVCATIRKHYRNDPQLYRQHCLTCIHCGARLIQKFQRLYQLTVEQRRDRCREALVDWIPYLYDGPKGEPMHALACNGLEAEKELYEAATEAAERMMGESWAQSIEGTAVPVQKHIAEAAMIGVARLRYRPHTALTSAWWAEHQSVCSAFVEQYDALAAPKVLAAVPRAQSTGTFDYEPF